MNVLICCLFLITIFVFAFFSIYCLNEGQTLKAKILLIIQWVLIIFYICLGVTTRNKIKDIGKQIEDRQIIGYVDNIILIEEEGGIKIPWYLNTIVINSDEYKVVADGYNGKITIYVENKDNKDIYTSKETKE